MKHLYYLLLVAMIGFASCHQDIFEDSEMYQQVDFIIGTAPLSEDL